jgi:predicted transcriptional regulator
LSEEKPKITRDKVPEGAKITKDRAEGPILRDRDFDPVLADGRKIRRLREERGMSVAELSRRSGISTSTIYKLQRGPKGRTWAARNYTLKPLADALGVEVAALEYSRSQ